MSDCIAPRVLKVTIPYAPKAKASVRVGKYGCYNPSSKGMNATKLYVRSQLNGAKEPLFTGPVIAIVHFRIPVAKCRPKHVRMKQHDHPHTDKPDGDNLEKFLNDSLNGVVWDDDSRIAWMLRSKSKTIDKVGSTTIFVASLKDAIHDYDEILSHIQDNIRINPETS